jgi:hypothetical protein
VSSVRASYDGPALDETSQHITEVPDWQDDGDGETVEVLGGEDAGEERYHNVPAPDEDPDPDTTGQTTIEDWGWSA